MRSAALASAVISIALLFVSAGVAKATPIDTVAEGCVTQLEMTPAQCLCAVGLIQGELDSRVLDYLAVRLQENWTEIERMRREVVTFDERIQLVIAMTRAVTICSDGAVTEIPL